MNGQQTVRARLVDHRGMLIGFCGVPLKCSPSQSREVFQLGLSCLPEVIHVRDGEYLPEMDLRTFVRDVGNELAETPFTPCYVERTVGWATNFQAQDGGQ